MIIIKVHTKDNDLFRFAKLLIFIIFFEFIQKNTSYCQFLPLIGFVFYDQISIFAECLGFLAKDQVKYMLPSISETIR